MKIAGVQAFPVWVDNRTQLLVRVTTDEGIHGWGESGLTSRERAVMGAVEHYAEWLVGRDPMNIAAAVAGDVPQPVFRGRPCARRPRFRRSTSRCTISKGRRLAFRSGSCLAASSAISSIHLPPCDHRICSRSSNSPGPVWRRAGNASGCHAEDPAPESPTTYEPWESTDRDRRATRGRFAKRSARTPSSVSTITIG